MKSAEDQLNNGIRRKNRKRIINNPNQSVGHWSEQEHKTYLNFLMAHKTIMESQDMKKTSKIFKLMSEIIGTRSPSQCRSHHQKFNPFVHHIKKRQKGAGRKKKEIQDNPQNGLFKQEVEQSQNFEYSNPLLSQFMIPPGSMYMPQNYMMPQQNQQVLSSFLQFQEIQEQMQQQNQNNQFFGMPQQYPAKQPQEGEDNEKYHNVMNNIMDQFIIPQQFQFQQQMLYPQQQFQQQIPYLDDKGSCYNFSFIQAPLNLHINYLPPFLNQQQEAFGDKQIDINQQQYPPQQMAQMFPMMTDEQMQMNPNDINQK